MKKFISIALLAASVAACSTPESDPNGMVTGENGFTRDTVQEPAEVQGEMAQIGASPEKAAVQVEQQVYGTSATGPDAPMVATNETAASTTATPATGTTTTAPAETKKKKKLNNTTKGVLIGTGAGLITGAAVNKGDRAKGALIGGLLGAVVGGTTGAVIDHRQKQK